MDGPLDLAGPATAHLRVGSSGPSTHVFVKLVDVAPDGAAHMLVRGQTEIGDPDPERVTRVELGHLGYRLLPGHRLRLQIAASDFPLYVPHPGTAENPWLATRWEPTEQSLACGGSAPAYVSLSVIAGGE